MLSLRLCCVAFCWTVFTFSFQLVTRVEGLLHPVNVRRSTYCHAVAKDTLSADIPTKPKRVARPKNYSSTSKVAAASPELVIDSLADPSIDILNRKKTLAKKVKSSPSEPHVDAELSSTESLNADIDDTNDPVILTVFGEPTPLSRHMVSRGHMYNPSAGLQKEFLNACLPSLPTVPLTGPLEATLFFYFGRPKNHFGTGKNAHVLKPLTAGKWHCKRKDLDNLVKFVLDALNAKAYEDDSQIAVIKSAKFYTLGEPYTKIILRKLSETDYEDFKF